MSKNIDVDEMILEVIDQIKDGREIASKFLEDLETALAQSKESHMTLGPIATQYMSKVQKSDDQIIKLIDILKRSIDKQREEHIDFDNLIGNSANDSSSVFDDDEVEDEEIEDLSKILEDD
jgi:hypothetical protein